MPMLYINLTFINEIKSLQIRATCSHCVIIMRNIACINGAMMLTKTQLLEQMMLEIIHWQDLDLTPEMIFNHPQDNQAIDKSFRKLSLLFHPDKFSNCEYLKALASNALKIIGEAKDYLKNNNKWDTCFQKHYLENREKPRKSKFSIYSLAIEALLDKTDETQLEDKLLANYQSSLFQTELFFSRLPKPLKMAFETKNHGILRAMLKMPLALIFNHTYLLKEARDLQTLEILVCFGLELPSDNSSYYLYHHNLVAETENIKRLIKFSPLLKNNVLPWKDNLLPNILQQAANSDDYQFIFERLDTNTISPFINTVQSNQVLIWLNNKERFQAIYASLSEQQKTQLLNKLPLKTIGENFLEQRKDINFFVRNDSERVTSLINNLSSNKLITFIETAKQFNFFFSKLEKTKQLALIENINEEKVDDLLIDNASLALLLNGAKDEKVKELIIQKLSIAKINTYIETTDNFIWFCHYLSPEKKNDLIESLTTQKLNQFASDLDKVQQMFNSLNLNLAFNLLKKLEDSLLEPAINQNVSLEKLMISLKLQQQDIMQEDKPGLNYQWQLMHNDIMSSEEKSPKQKLKNLLELKQRLLDINYVDQSQSLVTILDKFKLTKSIFENLYFSNESSCNQTLRLVDLILASPLEKNEKFHYLVALKSLVLSNEVQKIPSLIAVSKETIENIEHRIAKRKDANRPFLIKILAKFMRWLGLIRPSLLAKTHNQFLQKVEKGEISKAFDFDLNQLLPNQTNLNKKYLIEQIQNNNYENFWRLLGNQNVLFILTNRKNLNYLLEKITPRNATKLLSALSQETITILLEDSRNIAKIFKTLPNELQTNFMNILGIENILNNQEHLQLLFNDIEIAEYPNLLAHLGKKALVNSDPFVSLLNVLERNKRTELLKEVVSELTLDTTISLLPNINDDKHQHFLEIIVQNNCAFLSELLHTQKLASLLQSLNQTNRENLLKRYAPIDRADFIQLINQLENNERRFIVNEVVDFKAFIQSSENLLNLLIEIEPQKRESLLNDLPPILEWLPCEDNYYALFALLPQTKQAHFINELLSLSASEKVELQALLPNLIAFIQQQRIPTDTLSSLKPSGLNQLLLEVQRELELQQQLAEKRALEQLFAEKNDEFITTAKTLQINIEKLYNIPANERCDKSVLAGMQKKSKHRFFGKSAVIAKYQTALIGLKQEILIGIASLVNLRREVESLVQRSQQSRMTNPSEMIFNILNDSVIGLNNYVEQHQKNLAKIILKDSDANKISCLNFIEEIPKQLGNLLPEKTPLLCNQG